MADYCCQPFGQVVLDAEYCQPFIPPDLPPQLDDYLLGKIRPEPFDGPYDITGKAIAQYQHPPRHTADFDHLLAEGERLSATLGQVDLPDWNLCGQP